MGWFEKIMRGRYGADQLSAALLILSIILTFISRIARFPSLIYLVYILFGISLYRIFSKNIRKRSMENYKFVMLFSPIYSKIKKAQHRLKDLKTHRYYKCKGCKTKLRVPKGKGKIIITCPKCKNKFQKRT
jgi:Zn finger protein HypA/HybF involved in hydrogenase expression